MAKRPHVVVAHHDLNKRGGGEAVCMNVCEALEDEYDVTLLLSTRCGDLDYFNEYFNTVVTSTSVEVVTVQGIELGRLMAAVDRVTMGWLDYFSSSAQNALYNRYMAAAVPDCDLLVSTWNELGTDRDGLQYVHYPHRCDLVERSNTDNWLLKSVADAVDDLLECVSGFDTNQVSQDTVLTNSDWSREAVRETYDTDALVVHPPVRTEPFADQPAWEERENGFVFLSRVSPEKDVLMLIDIVTTLWERGHDVHFHIVGPPDTRFPEYYAAVEDRVDQYDYVTLEGELWGEALTRMLTEHRYGLNGAENEQFGIAIGEMIAAGMVPFLPNSGGQTTLVNERSDLLFDDTADAVEKIASALSDPNHCRSLRRGLPDIEAEYGSETFKSRIREIVVELLADS